MMHALQQSAIKGCCLCRLLCDNLSKHVFKSPAEHEFRILLGSLVDGDIMEFKFQLDPADDEIEDNTTVKFALRKSISMGHSSKRYDYSIASMTARFCKCSTVPYVAFRNEVQAAELDSDKPHSK